MSCCLFTTAVAVRDALARKTVPTSASMRTEEKSKCQSHLL